MGIELEDIYWKAPHKPRLAYVIPGGRQITQRVYLLEDAQVLKIGFEHEFLLRAAGLSHARSFELAPRLGYDDPLSWQLASAIYEELTGFADEIPSFLTITDEAATSSGT